ncbi:unnamed protein product [Lymnaea stagnalis]|uniref:C-type lectin domain-containing protein n=1 Tax=Lymnaea stagnalis TaxID=6523 RepID=A0AAV2H8I9_LYMST
MALSKATFKNVIFFIVLLEILLQRTQGQSSCAGKTERFINGTCYTFYDEFVTWQQAKIRCEERGKVLSSVDSKMQIKEMVTGQRIRTQVWIGASDIAKEGTFVWVHNNKTAVELLSIWNQNEPNDFGSNEDCVVIINTETNDAPCYFNFTYFCMETPKTDIIKTTVSITSRKTTTPLSTVKTTTNIITTTVSITSRTTITPLSTVKTTTDIITTTVPITSIKTITPLSTVKTTNVITTTESITSMNTITPVSTMKNSTGVEEPLLSQQNIYIISAASIGLLLLVLAIASIVVCRRKGLK